MSNNPGPPVYQAVHNSNNGVSSGHQPMTNYNMVLSNNGMPNHQAINGNYMTVQPNLNGHMPYMAMQMPPNAQLTPQQKQMIHQNQYNAAMQSELNQQMFIQQQQQRLSQQMSSASSNKPNVASTQGPTLPNIISATITKPPPAASSSAGPSMLNPFRWSLQEIQSLFECLPLFGHGDWDRMAAFTHKGSNQLKNFFKNIYIKKNIPVCNLYLITLWYELNLTFIH